MSAGELGDVGEHDHPVVDDLDEAAVHREPLLTRRLRARAAPGQSASAPRNGAWPSQERDVAAAERAHDHHVGLADVEHLLRRHELHFHDRAASALLQRLGLLEHRLDAADVEERLLGHVVELAADERLEASTVSSTGT